MKSLWALSGLPFIYKPLDTPFPNGPVPALFPFHLGVDEITGRLCQIPEKGLREMLEIVYSNGSEVTGMMEDRGIGKEYAEDFLSMFLNALGRGRLDGLRILEIGCGTGYLLHRLCLLGAEVIGVEPGPQAEAGRQRYGVPIIRDFFPSEQLEGEFDIAILYGSLEHFEDPVDFLGKIGERLAPRGRICVVVQDEESYIYEGDVSLLFHEHFSYFTERTLAATFATSGSDGWLIRKSKFSKLLFGICKFSQRNTLLTHVQDSIELAHRFRKVAERIVGRVADFIQDRMHAPGDVGIFVPSRAANLLIMAEIDLSGIRLFDDNPSLHGTYYPGIPMPVENREDLLKMFLRPFWSCLVLLASKLPRACGEIWEEPWRYV